MNGRASSRAGLLGSIAALSALTTTGFVLAAPAANPPQPAPSPRVPSAAAPAPGPPPALIGDGLWLGEGPEAKCLPVCGFPFITDPDQNGDLDGFGYEGQRTCIADGTRMALASPLCDVVPLAGVPKPGPGVFRETRCLPLCSSALSDPDPVTGLSDGWGYERRRNCIVPGTAAALGGLPCVPEEKPFVPGDGIEILVDAAGKLECRPLCRTPQSSDPDGDGFGFEHERSCIVSASLAALQGVPCDAEDLPPPPPPPPPPPGDGWSSDYTATMFGEIDCAPYGFDDPGDSDLQLAACVSTGAVKLDAGNQVYFGATGDLSSLWTGPPCRCQDGSSGSVCRTPPACPEQGNCGSCVEVTCNFEGKHSFQGDGITHNEFCKPGASVVVQLVDACPHNHPNNSYWCTSARKNHIDLSCTAFRALTEGRPIGQIGSINVHARPVDCSLGLGVKSF